MLQVLITGGFGFVGSELVALLYKRSDMHVTVIDNLMSRPDLDQFAEIRKYITFVEDDICNIRLICDLIRKSDVVIHLAAIVGAPACDINPRFSHMINVTATDTIVNALSRDQRIIFMSSTSSYGDKVNTLVTEDATLTPLTSYGVHKMIGESIVEEGKGQHIIFRPATAFGVSRMVRVDLLPNTLSYNALTTGLLDIFQPEVIRPFIHVADFARAIAYALDNHMPWDTTYNIGNPALTVTKAKLAQEIAALSGAIVVLREGSDPDKRNYDVSFAKLHATGFRSHATIKDGFDGILRNLTSIKADYMHYTTPGNVRAYLAKED